MDPKTVPQKTTVGKKEAGATIIMDRVHGDSFPYYSHGEYIPALINEQNSNEHDAFTHHHYEPTFESELQSPYAPHIGLSDSPGVRLRPINPEVRLSNPRIENTLREQFNSYGIPPHSEPSTQHYNNNNSIWTDHGSNNNATNNSVWDDSGSNNDPESKANGDIDFDKIKAIKEKQQRKRQMSQAGRWKESPRAKEAGSPAELNRNLDSSGRGSLKESKTVTPLLESGDDPEPKVSKDASDQSWRREAMVQVEKVICTPEELAKSEEKRKNNRHAAKRCRARKQERIHHLEKQITDLQNILNESNQRFKKALVEKDQLSKRNSILSALIRDHVVGQASCKIGAFHPEKISETTELLNSIRTDETDCEIILMQDLQEVTDIEMVKDEQSD